MTQTHKYPGIISSSLPPDVQEEFRQQLDQHFRLTVIAAVGLAVLVVSLLAYARV